MTTTSNSFFRLECSFHVSCFPPVSITRPFRLYSPQLACRIPGWTLGPIFVRSSNVSGGFKAGYHRHLWMQSVEKFTVGSNSRETVIRLEMIGGWPRRDEHRRDVFRFGIRAKNTEDQTHVHWEACGGSLLTSTIVRTTAPIDDDQSQASNSFNGEYVSCWTP